MRPVGASANFTRRIVAGRDRVLSEQLESLALPASHASFDGGDELPSVSLDPPPYHESFEPWSP